MTDRWLKKTVPLCLALCLLRAACTLQAAGTPQPNVDLRDSLLPSAVKSITGQEVRIKGKAVVADGAVVRVRVTTSLGQSFETRSTVRFGKFSCNFPQDFSGAPKLSPMLLYVDATDATEFGGDDLLEHQAEITLILSGGEGLLPELPLPFTDDFIDAQGRKDRQADQWPQMRSLVNLFMHSRAAKLMRIDQPEFDLAKPADFEWFKEHATLYDFDHRDRDWSQPLNHRVARGFWQAMWNTWFNPQNNHPWDGNQGNRAQTNFRPYTFANDLADILVLYQMQKKSGPSYDKSPNHLAGEVAVNLLAMQHRSMDNFALMQKSGKQEHYTAGAFRYGMFDTGEWLTEETGWFANPERRDFAQGGVFNGRCLWALGESLKADPNGPLNQQFREAIALTLRFCLHDGLHLNYTERTKSGHLLWSRPGEQGYMLLGMLAAAEVAPDLSVSLAGGEPARPLRELCSDALSALTEIIQADGTWSKYPNQDAVNITALAEGARGFAAHPDAVKWKSVAMRAADVWLALGPVPGESNVHTPLFGPRQANGMTYYVGSERHPYREFYANGLWLQSLSSLFAVTPEMRYADRAGAIVGYFCGNNPLHVRIFSEIGSVNNRATDKDADGIEDTLSWNAYPESTAFFQIGLLDFMRAVPQRYY